MSWTDWQREGRVEAHRPARKEIAAQRRAAERALRDASLPGLSPEGRFQLAYGAALDLATVAVLASGHRIRARAGHHQLTFEAAGFALGKEADSLVSYLEMCRRRRNIISYDADEVAEHVANELLTESALFAKLVDGWLLSSHRELL